VLKSCENFGKPSARPPLGVPYLKSMEIADEFTRRLVNQTRALGILLFGAPHFFAPRIPSPLFWPSHLANSVSHYDVAPLKVTLERLVDFDRISAGNMRFSAGAVNVRTGNFTYFDNTTHRITPAHVIASGSLPPGFPATEIDGEYYWDGGLVSNTPLQWVLDSRPRQDTLAFQIDLWSSDGEMPRDLTETDVRQKEIQFSSRTRAATDQYKKAQKLRLAVAQLINELPEELRERASVKMLEAEADDKICNIVHLIYHAKTYEGIAKDYEFPRRTMEEHWHAGYDDAVRTLSHPEVLQRPDKMEGVRTFDFTQSNGKRN
jgi:NTE family protein